MAFRPPAALLALIVACSSLIFACDDPESLRSVDLAELPERFACEDVTVVAASVDGSEALLIGVEDGLAAAAHESGEAVEAEYILPDERVTVRWVAGRNVYDGHCGRDAGGEWRLDERREAVAGSITVRLTPEGDSGLTLNAQLDDLLLAPMNDGDAPVYELSATRLDALRVDP